MTRVATPARPLSNSLARPASAPAPAKAESKYVILKDDAPAAAPRGAGNTKNLEAYLTASKLKPNEWFHWKDAPKYFGSLVKRWRKLMGREDVYAYRATSGSVIVRRQPAAAQPSEDD